MSDHQDVVAIIADVHADLIQIRNKVAKGYSDYPDVWVMTPGMGGPSLTAAMPGYVQLSVFLFHIDALVARFDETIALETEATA